MINIYILLIFILMLCQSCLAVYTNRTEFKADSYLDTKIITNDSTKVLLTVGLDKRTTSWGLPLIFIQGEKGDYSLNVSMYGVGLKQYRRFILNKVEIKADSVVAFQTTDPSFLGLKFIARTPEEKKAYGEFTRSYESAYQIYIDKSASQVSVRMEYSLVKVDGSYEKFVLNRRFLVRREKGFSLPSI